MIDKLLSQMSLEKKVGQLFQIGFYGTEVTPELREMILKYNVGGIIYFRRNIESLEQIAQVSNELHRLAQEKEDGIPLLISTDQEGGTVTRLTGATHFPGNMALGATGEVELARQVGQAVARELLGAGINMNLAPVLDVNNNPANPIIGVRSYGEVPEKVAEFGAALIQGMQREGVVACGKHFPGHGDTDTDSHLDLPIIRHDRKRLAEVELVPFKKAIATGLDSVMAAHIYFPAIEPRDGIPATLSPNVLTGLLRDELGFEGLIITDCMEMDAIVNTFGTVEGAIMTIEAGADMVLISHTLEKQQQAIQSVIEAVQSGRISEERVDVSVRRILQLKEKRFGLVREQIADWRQIDLAHGQHVADQIARKAVTLVKDEANLLPLDSTQKVMLMEFAMGQLGLVEDEGQVKSYIAQLLTKQGINPEHYIFPKKDTKLPELAGVDRVVICTYSATLDQSQAEVVKKVQALGIPLIVLSLRNPYDLCLFPEVSTFLTTYDYSKANLCVASEILVGKYQAQGVLPVTLEGIQ